MDRVEVLCNVFSFLEAEGFELTDVSYSPDSFGDCSVQWRSATISIRVFIDRGDFGLDIGDGVVWYALEDIRAFQSGHPPAAEMSDAFTPDTARTFLSTNINYVSSLFHDTHKRSAFIDFEERRALLWREKHSPP